jgi:hypothetical protein
MSEKNAPQIDSQNGVFLSSFCRGIRCPFLGEETTAALMCFWKCTFVYLSFTAKIEEWTVCICCVKVLGASFVSQLGTSDGLFTQRSSRHYCTFLCFDVWPIEQASCQSQAHKEIQPIMWPSFADQSPRIRLQYHLVYLNTELGRLKTDLANLDHARKQGLEIG